MSPIFILLRGEKQWKIRARISSLTMTIPSSRVHSRYRMRCWRAAYRTVLRIGAGYDCLLYEMLFVSGKALADRLGIVPIRIFSTFALNEHVLEDFGQRRVVPNLRSSVSRA